MNRIKVVMAERMVSNKDLSEMLNKDTATISIIYVSLLVEFFEYAIDPAILDYWGGVVCDVHDRIKRWFIYFDGNLVWSKTATLHVFSQ